MKSSKNTSSNVEKLLEYRGGLSSDDKKMEAGLLLEEIRKVDVEDAYLKVRSEIGRQSRFTRYMRVVTRIAAVFTLPLLAISVWSLFLRDNHSFLAENEITWHEITSPARMRSHVVLPDGTDLWLNAESKIKYGIPFVRESRQVYLTGEAFLNVSKNRKAPFIVDTGTASVKVLGTHFNVKAYPDESNLEVALLEGSVEFSGMLQNGKRDVVTLVPGSFLVLDKNSGVFRQEIKDLARYTAWYRNIIIFDETPMPEVAKTLERWYGVNVAITNAEINKYKITTTFESESLSRVLELLELSSPDIKIKYTAGKINKLTNIASQSTVSISKK
jgi:ferric-dicitrate binding protein FerR (iron transport regulator)